MPWFELLSILHGCLAHSVLDSGQVQRSTIQDITVSRVIEGIINCQQCHCASPVSRIIRDSTGSVQIGWNATPHRLSSSVWLMPQMFSSSFFVFCWRMMKFNNWRFHGKGIPNLDFLIMFLLRQSKLVNFKADSVTSLNRAGCLRHACIAGVPKTKYCLLRYNQSLFHLPRVDDVQLSVPYW